MRLLILALLLAGCADQPYVNPPTLEYITVRMVWVGGIETLRESCQHHRANGCATVGRYNGDLVTIWARKPTSFSDEPRLCTLGHELLHALGATH